jgi:PRTRC genetic system protein E
MFVALEPLLKSCGKLNLSLQMKGEEIVVFVMPQGTAKDPSLLQPLALTATAAELDAGFVDALLAYNGAHASLAEQVAATAAILGAAEQTQVSKATKALGKGGKPALPAPSASTASDTNDDDDDSDADPVNNGEEGNASLPSVAETKPSGTDLTSLFD